MRNSLRYLYAFVMGYMLLAFFWWAVHLWRQNNELYFTGLQLLDARFGKGAKGLNETALAQTAEYRQLTEKRDRQRRMILAEGIFFTGCLLFGVWAINRSAQREVSLTRQRRNFLLSITHELKSPIAAMRLVLETFQKRELAKEQREKMAANGLRDAARLQNLVEDMLLAARLEDSWHPLHEPVDLQAIVHDCIEGLLVRFPQAHIHTVIPDKFSPVIADKAGLTAIIQNLLENAVKYSPEGSLVSLRADRNNGKFALSVADEGPGIPDAEKSAIFEKFYRLGNEETRQATGTGLGLYIVQQVVAAHKGAIKVSDNKPRGTIFSIEI